MNRWLADVARDCAPPRTLLERLVHFLFCGRPTRLEVRAADEHGARAEARRAFTLRTGARAGHVEVWRIP